MESFEVYGEVKKYCGNTVQVHINTPGTNTMMSCTIRKKTNLTELRRRGQTLTDFYALVQPINDCNWKKGEVICFYSDEEKRQLMHSGDIKDDEELADSAFIFSEEGTFHPSKSVMVDDEINFDIL